MTPEQKANINALRVAFAEADAKRNEASAALRSAVIATSPFLPGDIIRSSRGDLAFVRSVIAFHAGGPVMNCYKVKRRNAIDADKLSLWR